VFVVPPACHHPHHRPHGSKENKSEAPPQHAVYIRDPPLYWNVWELERPKEHTPCDDGDDDEDNGDQGGGGGGRGPNNPDIERKEGGGRRRRSKVVVVNATRKGAAAEVLARA